MKKVDFLTLDNESDEIDEDEEDDAPAPAEDDGKSLKESAILGTFSYPNGDFLWHHFGPQYSIHNTLKNV